MPSSAYEQSAAQHCIFALPPIQSLPQSGSGQRCPPSPAAIIAHSQRNIELKPPPSILTLFSPPFACGAPKLSLGSTPVNAPAMYWPAATPRIYIASTNRQDAVPAVTISHDGLPPPDDASNFADARKEPAKLQTHSANQEAFQKSASSSSLAPSHDGLSVPAAAASPLIPTSPLTPMTPAIKSVEHGYMRDGSLDDAASDPHVPHSLPLVVPLAEPVLALRLSRSCHLFATITATSMTIWQAKVRLISLSCPFSSLPALLTLSFAADRNPRHRRTL